MPSPTSTPTSTKTTSDNGTEVSTAQQNALHFILESLETDQLSRLVDLIDPIGE